MNYIDVHEHDEIKTRFTDFQEIALEVGDVQLGEYLIERKSADDFLSSLTTGRIFQQLAELSNYNAIVCVHDDIHRAMMFRGISYNAYLALLATIAFKFKVPLLFLKDREEYIAFVRQASKTLAKKSVPPARRVRAHSLRDEALSVMQGFRGVGPHKAARLLTDFGNLRNLFASLDKIKGKIGVHLREVANYTFQ